MGFYISAPSAAEDIEESALLGVHQACQAASLAKTAVDKSQVPGWPAFQDSIDSLAQEVRNAAPAKLYPPHQLMSVQQPAAELQQQQLQHITQVLIFVLLLTHNVPKAMAWQPCASACCASCV